MPTYSFSPSASLLPLLHASRYPHCTIIGCFLGPLPLSSAPEGTIELAHAVPLLHHWTGLSFALEAGLQLVQEYATTKQWEILGLYYGNESIEDTARSLSTPPILVKRLKEQLDARDPGNGHDYRSHIFALDNCRLDSEQRAFVLIHPAPGSSGSHKPKFKYTSTPSASASPSRLPSLLKKGQQDNLDDWDAHLEDLGARWLGNESVDLSLEDEEIESRVKEKENGKA